MGDSRRAVRLSLSGGAEASVAGSAVVLALLLTTTVLSGPVPGLQSPSREVPEFQPVPATTGAPRTVSAPWSCHTCGRINQAVAYDSTDGYLVAFGGLIPVGPDPEYVDSNQTWIYQGHHWQLLNTGPGPSARFGATLVNDPKDGYVLLFGGMGRYTWSKTGPGAYSSSYSILNDTWKFSHGTWTRLSTPVAPARQGTGPGPGNSNAAAYDASDGYVVFIQTYCGGQSRATYGCYTTTWKFVGGNWSTLAVNVQARACFGAAAYDSAAMEVLLTGFACTNGGVGNETTWTYAGGNWTNDSATSGWVPELGPTQTLSDDPANGGVLAFGGYNYHNNVVNNVTREFRAGKWVNLTLTRSPPPVQGAFSAYDLNTHSTLLFWGENVRQLLNPLDEVWSLSHGTWSNVTARAPSARYGAGLASDASAGGLVLFGGTAGGRVRNDTWTFSGGDWTLVNTPTAPSARTGFSFAYDPASRSVILFGGHAATYLNDTWSFANGTWAKLSTPRAPPAREYASLGYDSSDGALVLFGGTNGGFLGDTWILKHGTWTNVTSLSSNAPSARYGASLADDRSNGYLVLFGGFDGRYLADTWTYQHRTWTLLPTLTNPTGRVFAGMTYDPAASMLVLVGGYDGTFLGDTWTFASGAWAHVIRTVDPPPRELANLGYSPAAGGVVLFGGLGAGGRPLVDVWSI